MALNLRTSLCNDFGIDVPVVLAGMAAGSQSVASADLAAAISNAGGLGVLGGGPLSADRLQREVRRLKSLTTKPFGVDLLLPAGLPGEHAGWAAADDLPGDHRSFVARLQTELGIPQFTDHRPLRTERFVREQLEVVLDEHVPVLACALGAPRWAVEAAHACGSKVIAVVGNVRSARKARDAGADAIVAQGHEAGGHTGRVGTMALVPQVADAVAPLPVLAAGGIGDGRGLAASLALGAQGAWIGTAFLVAHESPVAAAWKERILAMDDEGTCITRSYTGKTMRAIQNEWTRRWEKAPVAPLKMPYQDILVGHIKEAGIQTGDARYLAMPAGQIGGMVRAAKPAAQILRELVDEARQILCS